VERRAGARLRLTLLVGAARDGARLHRHVIGGYAEEAAAVLLVQAWPCVKLAAGRDWRSGGVPPGSGPWLWPGIAVRLGE
jgi:hypothetical protein